MKRLSFLIFVLSTVPLSAFGQSIEPRIGLTCLNFVDLGAGYAFMGGSGDSGFDFFLDADFVIIPEKIGIWKNSEY
jgi:hypothetical protein